MAQDKEFYIKIGGIKESIDNLSTLEEALSSIEKKVNTVNSNGGFTVASKESNKAMDELGKLTQKITQYDKEYQMAVEASKGVLKDKNQEVKQAIELEKANIVVQEGAKSTYYEKQQLLSALGKQIKSMNADTEEEKQKQQELISQYSSLNQELKDFDASLGNHQRNVGDYRGALRETTQEIRAMQGEMAQMLMNGVDKADPKFQELAKKAGQLQDAIGDARQEVARFASDTKRLDDVINIAQSATAAFELYKGTMSAFGIETEGAEEAIQKLAGAMSIIQSLQTLQDTLSQGSATAKLFNVALKATGVELVTTQLASIKATAAQEGLTVAQKAGTIATKTLSLAIKAIPLMLVIGLVTELILHWEDLVGWFNRTFPALKKLGGAMNALKAVFVGFGKAIINWVTNPLRTLANVIQKIFQGDFSGAMQAVTDGIKNQFQGTAKAFKEGFQAQVKNGLEDITKKAAEEQAKQTKYELDMLKARKGNQARYSKEGVELQKKEFAERRKAAKGNQEELKKIALDEANFFRECEEQKTAATKKSAAGRVRANKDAAAEAKRLADEEKKRREQEEKDRKDLVDAGKDLVQELINTEKIQNKELQRQKKLEQERYSTGPLEKYIEKTLELHQLVKQGTAIDMGAELNKTMSELEKEYSKLGLKADEVRNIAGMTNDEIKEYVMKFSGLTQKEALKLETILLKLKNSVLSSTNELQEAAMQSSKDIANARKAELDTFKSDADRTYKWLMNRVKGQDVTPVTKDNIWGKLFGVIDEKETLEKYERIKHMWVRAYNDIQVQIEKSQSKWDEYLNQIELLYGKDSMQYKKAVQDKMDALEELRKKAIEVGKVANSPTSLDGDYNADGNADSGKPKRKLWYGKNDRKSDGSPYNLFDNVANLFNSLDETVLAPAMDTFSMFMDFAIEETAQRLEQVQELHDKALDKVNESADKIKELNEAIKDSGNDNMEATKQQLADEQLLYAQRLAEEKKLAEEERNLKNKQAQQEANARKMELRYQMVMGIANTAQGASKALAEWGWPLGAVFAGIMTALGLVQTALIAKQIGQIKPVKYAEGGVINGKSHAQGGVPIGNTGIEVEGGEMVVSKKNTVKYIDVLTKINRDDPSVRYLRGGNMYADTRIRKFANGGQLNFKAADDNLRANSETNRLMSAINDIDMSPVVSVVDIWKAENRLTKVRGLAGRE